MPDKKGSVSKIKMPDVDELFAIGQEDGSSEGEHVRDVGISELRPFKGHPFRVLDDGRMQETVDSIREFGVLNPVLARPVQPHGYEIIAGHRRKRACEILGIEKIPCIIRELSDEEATIAMVDSNIQRDELLPSEKAFAYKMKLDAVKKQGKRQDLTCCQIDNKLKGKKSSSMIAEEMGESQKQVYRYIRLTSLIKPLLDMVDEKRIPFIAGGELSYLQPEEQELLLKVMERHTVFPNLAQSVKIRQLGREGRLDETGMELVLNGVKTQRAAIKLHRKKLDDFFPHDYSSEQIEEVIYGLLQRWSAEHRTEMQDKTG
jgi:ParB-like partition proteins